MFCCHREAQVVTAAASDATAFLFQDPKRMVVYTPGFLCMWLLHVMLVWVSHTLLTRARSCAVEGAGLDDDELREMCVQCSRKLLCTLMCC